jgi:hypothetical protein
VNAFGIKYHLIQSLICDSEIVNHAYAVMGNGHMPTLDQFEGSLGFESEAANLAQAPKSSILG